MCRLVCLYSAHWHWWYLVDFSILSTILSSLNAASLQECSICVRIKIPTTPIFYGFGHKPECYIQLSCSFEIIKGNIYFFQKIFRFLSIHGKVTESVSPILHLTVSKECLRISSSSLRLLSSMSPISGVLSALWAPDTLWLTPLFCLCSRNK